ncbi:MFS transporter [Achromobacter xylosoxidans]|uniref:MFS transporter n=2 Tax=Alcaligenes xylosoxydans xylosoxydans TaxID=85698 RepID=UPI0006AC3C48|nr:MFS transporter [Achromobacter xylosoxidans]AUZ18311.1 MFS transporter [Achromobacter xylosoxidans]AXA78209.1 MFS transporter [Achromobacter xylosoxidans]KOQ28896.1 MFS transporter [Achromobacter xylosoxidans]KOQ30850.1 MFS transporter [Achromobacter xylosoxidans]KOQ41758.1 MFS transporter [Achromobacter xylosoxidans]
MSALPPAFRRLASSNLAAQFSEQIALAAAPLVAVLALGATAAQTGYLQTAQTLPFLLLSLPAGVLADRLPRRTLMTSAECVRAASLLALLALLALGGLNLGWLAALGFLGAVGTVAYNVAAPALVPTLVPAPALGQANRWLELARSAAFSAGPALGGALVGGIGAAAAYGLATLLSLLAAGLLAGLPPQAPRAAARRHLWHELRDGAAFVTGHPLLRPVLVTAVFFNLAWFVLQAVYVVYAVERLGLGAAGVGITLGVYGAGMLAGALAAPWLAGRLSFGALIAAGPLCALAASLILLSTLALPSGLWAAAGFFLFGAGPILWTIATTTLRQAITPNALLGRVSAVILTATFGARPVGALIGAALASRLGLEACLWVSSAGFAAQFVVLAASPVPRLRSQPEPVTG